MTFRWYITARILVSLILVVLLNGCSVGRAPVAASSPADPVNASAALPTSVKDLSDELRTVRARERLLEGALADARTDAVQTKLWLGAGACFLAALVLVGIGIWTSRRLLIEIGVAAAGLGGLLIFAAWLAPYALLIGIVVAVAVIGTAAWMLLNRQRSLEQVTRAVDAIKNKVPDYREIFRQHIDTGAERLIHHVRDNRSE
jgi:hypothetical protein